LGQIQNGFYWDIENGEQRVPCKNKEFAETFGADSGEQTAVLSL